MFITVSGVKTQYQLLGKNSSKPVLVLLHGWLCDWQIWSPVIPLLSESFTLLIPDLPGFGSSEAGQPTWDSPRYVQWLQEFIPAALGSSTIPFAVAGHSFGGKVAALYAAQNTSPALQQILLVDAAGLPDKLPPLKQLQKTLLSVIPQSLKTALPSSLRHKLLRATNSATDYHHSNPAQKAILKKSVGENISDALPKITIPTTLIWGELDDATPLHQGQAFHRLIPGSKLHTFPQANHFPFVTDPTRFAMIIQESAA